MQILLWIFSMIKPSLLIISLGQAQIRAEVWMHSPVYSKYHENNKFQRSLFDNMRQKWNDYFNILICFWVTGIGRQTLSNDGLITLGIREIEINFESLPQLIQMNYFHLINDNWISTRCGISVHVSNIDHSVLVKGPSPPSHIKLNKHCARMEWDT